MFYKHSWVIFISEKPFWWSTLQNSCLWNVSVMKCQSLMSGLMLSHCKEIREAFSFFFKGFFFLIWRPWGVLGLLWRVSQMKLKDQFRIKVWRSKISRWDGGQRPLNHCPQRWWRAACPQPCRYSTAAELQACRRTNQEQSQGIPSWLKKDCGTGFLIIHRLHLKAPGSTPKIIFFSLSLLFQNIKPEASSVMTWTRRLTRGGRNV